MAITTDAPDQTRPSRDQVLDDVKRIVAEILGTAAENVRQEHELENDLGCDSLELVEILMETEEHFGLDVPDALGEQVRTVGDVVDGVLRLMGRSDSCRGRP